MSEIVAVSDAVRVNLADGAYWTKSTFRSKGAVTSLTPFILSFQFPELSLKSVGLVVIVWVLVSSVFGVEDDVYCR